MWVKVTKLNDKSITLRVEVVWVNFANSGKILNIKKISNVIIKQNIKEKKTEKNEICFIVSKSDTAFDFEISLNNKWSNPNLERADKIITNEKP